MKKRLLKNAMLRKRIWLRKMFLRMNYLFCLLVLGALSVSAEVYSQNGLVSLKMKDVSLVKVFNEITKQTGYDFLYNYDLIQNKGTVDVNAKMVDLKDFLLRRKWKLRMWLWKRLSTKKILTLPK